MPSPKLTTEMKERPTLPSIHTLNLPLLSRPRNMKNEANDNLRRSHTTPVHRHGRQASTSSSHTGVSRNSSPSPVYPSDSESDGDIASSSMPQCPTKLRLVPCPLEDAEAIIVVSDTPLGASNSNYAPQQAKHSVLIMGPSLQRFRNPQRPLAKGARLHPYRIIRDGKALESRRSSVISITAFSNSQ